MIRANICAALVAAVLAWLAGWGIAAPAIGDGCITVRCDKRVKTRVLARHYERAWARAPANMRSHLRAIAWCESTNNERAISRDGRYRGLLQFDYRTWATVGGRGDPAAASRMEQWARGARLYARRGAVPWPVCGR